MALPRGSSSALLRRAASQAALNGRRGNGGTAEAAPDGDLDSPPAPLHAAAGPGCRRLVVRCMLLLHTALVASLLLATVTNITSRQHRNQELAQRLLESGSTEAGSWEAPVNGTALQQCSKALALPQVALLFLVKGPFHHETLWRLWFQSAAGLLPADAVAGAVCSGGGSSSSGGSSSETRRQQVLQACRGVMNSPDAAHAGATGAPVADWTQGGVAPKGRALQSGSAAAAGPAAGAPRSAAGSTSNVIDQQVLFDVYVHPHPDFTGYLPGSLFHGRELLPQERVVTEWGQHSLVDAARALLRAAYRNLRITKFVLLSESDLPLYSPLLLYSQLVNERLSRINACNTTRGWRLFDHRWVDRMATLRLQKHHWRKSWQWFALTRDHVELILKDTEVDAALRAHCRTMYEPERKKERECYSDEHVFPTLLAMHGRDNETDCQGWLTDTDWSRVHHLSAHPYEYPAEEVTDALLHRLRRPRLPGCRHAAAAAATAAEGFLPASSLQAARTAGTAGAASSAGTAALTGLCLRLEQQLAMHKARHRPLGPHCRLLARKFLNHTAHAALAAVAPCDSSALVLNKGVCPFETPLQAGNRRRWQHTALLALVLGGTLLLLPPLLALLLGAVGSAAAGRRSE